MHMCNLNIIIINSSVCVCARVCVCVCVCACVAYKVAMCLKMCSFKKILPHDTHQSLLFIDSYIII